MLRLSVRAASIPYPDKNNFEILLKDFTQLPLLIFLMEFFFDNLLYIVRVASLLITIRRNC